MPHPTRRAPGVLAAAFAALLVTAAPGSAGLVCDALGDAAAFSALATGRLRTAGGNSRLVGTFDAVCAGSARLQTFDLRPFHTSAAELVLTAADGTAVRFLAPPASYRGGDDAVEGNIRTGGGAVVGPVDLTGDADTSGTHPLVGRCAQAMSDARSASATLAALAPTRVLGKVRVSSDDTFELDARGGAVIEMESLVLEGVRGQCPGFPNSCDCFDSVAALEIRRNPGDQVVINTGALSVGRCALIQLGGSGHSIDTIINVPGPGRRIQVGFGADLEDGASLLAPERSLIVEGAGPDVETALAALWVERARLGGVTIFYPPSPCP
jgi:hypothetical protein